MARKAAKKPVAKKSVAKKAVAKKATAKKATTKKVVARKTAAKKAPARKGVAKKAPARKATAVKAKAKVSVAKKPKIGATPNGSTDKEHLMDIIQGCTGATKTASKEALEAVLETVAVSLKKNEKVQLLGFGTFEVSKRKARKGRNPATGESIKIKASKSVRFRPGTKLKAAV